MYEIGDIVRLIETPEQLGYVCRTSLLGSCCSFGICPFEGPVYPAGLGMKGIFGPRTFEWELDTSELTGTVSTTKNSSTVQGTGTLFTTEYSVSDKIIVGMWEKVIVSIESDTELTVDTVYIKTCTDLSQRKK
jgi:hypothetical protein